MTDARAFLTTLVGRQLCTITHDAPTRVLSVEASTSYFGLAALFDALSSFHRRSGDDAGS
jgi:hypothetical protein